MPKKIRVATIVIVVLLVPIVPFVAIGWWFEPWVAARFQNTGDPTYHAWLAVILLASDLLLPIPSSAVCAWAGRELGLLGGTGWCWVGLMVGSMTGFALARYAGYPLATRLTSRETMADLSHLNLWGPWLLVFTRPLPILAEAAVLLTGLNRLGWVPFLVVMAVSNAAVAVVFVSTGQMAAHHDRFASGLVVVVVIPLVVAMIVRRWLRSSAQKLGNHHHGDHDEGQQ